VPICSCCPRLVRSVQGSHISIIWQLHCTPACPQCLNSVCREPVNNVARASVLIQIFFTWFPMNNLENVAESNHNSDAFESEQYASHWRYWSSAACRLLCWTWVFFQQIVLESTVNEISAVGIAPGYGLDDRGVRVWVPVGSRMIPSPHRLGRTQSSIEWVPGALSPGVKWPGREADHSPPTSAEVKKYGSIHPLPHTPPWRSA
jgi:hypothetical protein